MHTISQDDSATAAWLGLDDLPDDAIVPALLKLADRYVLSGVVERAEVHRAIEGLRAAITNTPRGTEARVTMAEDDDGPVILRFPIVRTDYPDLSQVLASLRRFHALADRYAASEAGRSVNVAFINDVIEYVEIALGVGRERKAG